MLTLLTIGVLLVSGLVLFAAVIAVLKLALFLVFLPLKLAFRLVMIPLHLVLGLLAVPVVLIVAAACGIGLLAALLAVAIPLAPFAIIAAAVWVMMRRGRTARAV